MDISARSLSFSDYLVADFGIHILFKNIYGVTVHSLSHRIYLFSFLQRTHLLWGLYSYDWYHCMYLIGSTSFSLFLL
jgi:hypothetical protein